MPSVELALMVFFEKWKFKSKTVFVLLLALAVQVVVVPNAYGLQITVPEIEARVSDQFLLESVAKLDDFIEDIRAKEKLRGVENVGFAVSAMVQLGTVTGILLDQFLFKKKLVSGVVDEVKKVSTAGQAGKFPLELSGVVRKWMVGTSAVNIAVAKKPKELIVHVEDLALFREILTVVRNKQAGILLRMWQNAGKEDVTLRTKLLNMETLIREQRPSFKEIYESCSADPGGYKSFMAMEMYRKSLGDYFGMLLLTPNAITKQVNSSWISPTLRNYINQDVLPIALNKCFNISTAGPAETVSEFRQFVLSIPVLGAGVSMVTDVANNEHHRFVAQLFAVDAMAKFVTFAAVFAVFRVKELFHASKAPGINVAGKFNNAWLGDVLNKVQTMFAKISPALIAKVIVTTQVAVSSYSLFVIKKEYDIAKDEGVARRSSEEFNRLAKKYFQDRAIEQIAELKKLLGSKELDLKDRAAVENELRSWQLLEVEFAS